MGKVILHCWFSSKQLEMYLELNDFKPKMRQLRNGARVQITEVTRSANPPDSNFDDFIYLGETYETT